MMNFSISDNMDFKGGLSEKLLLSQAAYYNSGLLTPKLVANNPNVTPQNFHLSDHESASGYRPLPKFFTENATFSTKKEKETPKLSEVHPPKPPIKSCPPISRIRPCKLDREGARVISFDLNGQQQQSNGAGMST